MSIFVKLCSLICRVFGIESLYEDVSMTKSEKKFKVSMIAAMSLNRVIGKDGDIPWRGQLKGEQLLFKKHTEGKVVIMGRKTYYSLPKKFRPLPKRFNIVLTSNPQPSDDGHVECSTMLEALLLASTLEGYDEAVLIGGQRVYEEGLIHAGKIHLTVLDAIFPGDTYFPELPADDWVLDAEQIFPAGETGNTIDYTFKTFGRRIL